MIHNVTFKNFFSFKDSGVIDFTVSDKAPQTQKYITDKTNTRLSKIMSVFGYNASGKTNALKSVAFLRYLIVVAYSEDPDKAIPVFPFKFVNKTGVTELSTKFSIGDNLYFYYIELTAKNIISEKLQIKSSDANKFKTLFKRTLDEKGEYTWSDSFGLGQGFQKRLRKNASVLATAFRDNHEESAKIVNFWKSVNTNVTVAGKIDNELHSIAEAAAFFNDNKVLKDQMDKFLQKFDLGLTAINIEVDTKNKSISLQGVHNGDYELSFEFESSGTKKFFSVLRHVLQVLSTGGVAVLDEFDTDLHPMMSEALLEMFSSPDKNPKNAQLIFSAHSPHLLNLLDKYQIALTEKNKKGESDIWRLDEMKGVRADDNYYAKYLLGAYGATPNLEL